MRLELMQPKGATTAALVRDALALVMEQPPTLETIARWTQNELLIVYDWAMREHAHASDYLVRRRPRPYLVTMVIDARAAGATY